MTEQNKKTFSASFNLFRMVPESETSANAFFIEE
jgi:hypothetical protein